MWALFMTRCRRQWLAFRILCKFGETDSLLALRQHLENQEAAEGNQIDRHVYIADLINHTQQRMNWDNVDRAKDLPEVELPPFEPSKGRWGGYDGF